MVDRDKVEFPFLPGGWVVVPVLFLPSFSFCLTGQKREPQVIFGKEKRDKEENRPRTDRHAQRGTTMTDNSQVEKRDGLDIPWQRYSLATILWPRGDMGHGPLSPTSRPVAVPSGVLEREDQQACLS